MPFQIKVRNFSRKQNIPSLGNTSRGATRFRPGSYSVQFVYKRYPQNPGVQLSLFADDMYLYATIAKKVMLSEIWKWVSLQWNRGVSAGTLKVNEDRTKPPTSAIDESQSRITLY